MRRWLTLAAALLLVAYFVRMSLATLHVTFARDDMMNIAYYWHLPPWQALLGPLMPWKTLYRPLGGWLLLPILRIFGLNPVAFRVGMLVFLLANVFLIRRLCQLLGTGERAAWLVALIACYHVGLSNLYFNIPFVFDVLCGFFFVAALLYYVSLRQRDVVPNWRQVVAFLALYLAALDAKEMAVTLPAALLLYEWFYHPPLPWSGRALLAWLRGPGRSVVAAGCLTLVCLAGRVLGKGGLAHDPGYQIKLSMARVWTFQLQSFGDLFEKWEYFGRAGVAAIWIALFYFAWRRPRPVLRFAVLCLLVTPLPIEFLIGRAGACLYIPMVAWAILVSVLFVDAADAISRVLVHEPGFRRLGPPARLSAVMVAAGALFWAYQNADLKRRYLDPATHDWAPETWSVIQQLKAIAPPVRPHSTVVFLDDPMGNWDMLFIAELHFRDRTVVIRLNRKTPLTPDEIAKADYLFDCVDGRLVRVR
jgi:hypothetical protein